VRSQADRDEETLKIAMILAVVFTGLVVAGLVLLVTGRMVSG
jgi:hypothetical protein